jgi:hypothetical protein
MAGNAAAADLGVDQESPEEDKTEGKEEQEESPLKMRDSLRNMLIEHHNSLLDKLDGALMGGKK